MVPLNSNESQCGKMTRSRNSWGLGSRNHIKGDAAESAHPHADTTEIHTKAPMDVKPWGKSEISVTTTTVSPNWVCMNYNISSGERQLYKYQAWQADPGQFPVPIDFLDLLPVWIGQTWIILPMTLQLGWCQTERGKGGEEGLIHFIFLVGGRHPIQWVGNSPKGKI